MAIKKVIKKQPNERLSIKSVKNSSCEQEDRRPLLSLQYLEDVSIRKNKDPKMLWQLLNHFREICSHSWNEIATSGRHSMIGYEFLPKEEFVPKKFPSIVSEEYDKLMVFRSAGDNRVMAGVRKGDTFYVIFVETEFGDICTHGR